MVGHGRVQGATDEQVDAFLELFDGNIHDAFQALHTRSLSGTVTEPKTKPAKVAPTGPVVLSVRNVVKEYKIGRQKLTALNDVSLDVHEGEFIALTGSSGSGKSTLLQLMGGLDKVSSGTIAIDTVSLGTLNDRSLSAFRNKTIGFVFQFFYLQPFLPLGRNIEVPGMFYGSQSRVRKERVAELLKAVGLEDRANHLPKELSGGQMQRAAIARALLNTPKILLADEPTGNLDSANSDAIIELFDKIRKDFGTTIIMVTHDRDIAAHADREIILKDGSIV